MGFWGRGVLVRFVWFVVLGVCCPVGGCAPFVWWVVVFGLLFVCCVFVELEDVDAGVSSFVDVLFLFWCESGAVVGEAEWG